MRMVLDSQREQETGGAPRRVSARPSIRETHSVENCVEWLASTTAWQCRAFLLAVCTKETSRTKTTKLSVGFETREESVRPAAFEIFWREDAHSLRKEPSSNQELNT